jgi:hypothetical protein
MAIPFDESLAGLRLATLDVGGRHEPDEAERDDVRSRGASRPVERQAPIGQTGTVSSG